MAIKVKLSVRWFFRSLRTVLGYVAVLQLVGAPGCASPVISFGSTEMLFVTLIFLSIAVTSMSAGTSVPLDILSRSRGAKL